MQVMFSHHLVKEQLFFLISVDPSLSYQRLARVFSVLLASRQHINIRCVLCSPVIGTESYFSKLHLPHTQQPPNRNLCTLHRLEHDFLTPPCLFYVPFLWPATSSPWLLRCGTPTHPPILSVTSPSPLLSLLCSGQRNRASPLFLFGFLSISPNS